MTSPAVVNFGPAPGPVELRDVPPPRLGDADVLLEVASVGVCVSDIHQWKADHSWRVNYPVVPGHEFGGRVVDAGRAVTGWPRDGRRLDIEAFERMDRAEVVKSVLTPA